MAAYVTQPSTDAERRSCIAGGVKDTCTEKLDATECLGEGAGLTKLDTASVTIPPSSSVVVYVAAYFSTSSSLPHSGDYALSARTDALN